jgi:hypothetical protein
LFTGNYREGGSWNWQKQFLDQKGILSSDMDSQFWEIPCVSFIRDALEKTKGVEIDKKQGRDI